jgi:hypothetical protein
MERVMDGMDFMGFMDRMDHMHSHAEPASGGQAWERVYAMRLKC